MIALVGNTLGLELKKFEDCWYYNLHWIKKYLEVFGIGIGIQRPCKYWDWDLDWERGNLYKIFGIGLGIGFLNAYNSEIGIEPYEVIDQINSCTLKKCQTESFFPIVCSHLQVKTREKIILLSLQSI